MNGLGRRRDPDPRDHDYLMRRRLASAPVTPLPASKTWAIKGPSLDQGDTSTCVGHAWKNFLRCAPLQTQAGPSQYDIYRSAVHFDPWPENNLEGAFPDADPRMASGTSVRAGAEAVQATGRLKSFLWAFDLQTVIEWVLTKGPVVLGTNWYDSMMGGDAHGRLKIPPGAKLLGGHAFLMRGANARRALATCENSWGDDWGKAGSFLLPFHELERLIHEDGEACAAVEKRVTKVLA